MTQLRRFNIATPLDTLDTYESIIKKSNDASGKLIVALFNTEFFEGRTVENKLKTCRQHYEKNDGTQFYKYIVTKREQKIKTDFKIDDIPTIIFFRNGIEIDRIEDFDEANPAIPLPTNEIKETKDEEEVRKKLDQLCKPV